ncbi:MAG: hypothetical protein M0R46_06020 [Candidatus Muirbacterium halophilum]|nr:hypothetical protein [Candidatus Muirbacterium halophilum]MCK9475451.1 hypothetical protein [Candidatus Muirbacterium halophilum]
MRINLNVFPKHYQCEPRDYKAIFFAGLTLIVMIVMIFSVYIIQKWRFSSMQTQSLEPLRVKEEQMKSLQTQKARKETDLRKNIFPEATKEELNERITSFNKIERDFYWGLFFQKLEEVIPERVWLKNFFIETSLMKEIRIKDHIEDIKRKSNISHEKEMDIIKNINRKIYLSCEASDMFKPIEFIKNLELNEYFSNIIVGKAQEDSESLSVRFTIEFEINENLFKRKKL